MDKNFIDVLFYFVPALIAVGAMFLLVKKYLERDRHLRMTEIRSQQVKDSMPLKLQAIERMVLFLERISPDSLFPRLHRSGITAAQLHADALSTIRAEFDHNLTQQVYLTDNTWSAVKKAKEELVRLLNVALSETGSGATGIHLSSKVFDLMMKMDDYPHQKALDVLKAEARRLIG